jgi:elongation factor Ts
MTEISAQAVKDLRERTGAGFMDCKRALEATGGDVEAAVTQLREKGLAAAAKRAGRDAREGLISSYIHTGGRVGVLIEVNWTCRIGMRRRLHAEIQWPRPAPRPA